MKKTLLVLLVLLVLPGAVLAQEMVLTGVVTTRDDGLSLPGATVSIEALKLSATADAEGRYSITLPPGTSTTTVLEVPRT